MGRVAKSFLINVFGSLRASLSLYKTCHDSTNEDEFVGCLLTAVGREMKFSQQQLRKLDIHHRKQNKQGQTEFGGRERESFIYTKKKSIASKFDGA